MEMTTELYIVAYLVICIFVAIEGSLRGHNFLYALVFSLLCSPLIGAILFSPFKPKP